MSETYHLKLPLVQAGQAQKHITVNEGLARLDALVQRRAKSRTLSSPPLGALDGESYLVPEGASGDWTGADGSVAVFTNTGWSFYVPLEGWEIWIEDEGKPLVWVSGAWHEIGLPVAPSGAATLTGVIELDHTLSVGQTSLTSPILPAKSSIVGVTARVTSEIVAGSATGWSLGVDGSDDRYGTGYGLALNSFAVGLTSQPLTYWSETPLLITAEGGSFVSGAIRLSVHYMILTPPVAV